MSTVRYVGRPKVGGALRGWYSTPLALLLLSLTALSPLLRPGLLATHDGLYHVISAVEIEALLSEGRLYPRWAGDMAYGLGYPMPQFRAPIFYYLQVGFHWLGLPFTAAFEAGTAVALLIGAFGVYLLTRDLLGRLAGLLAATAYVYAPFTLMNAYVRGDAPELLAHGFLAFSLWSFRRLVLHPSFGWLTLAALSYAALILSHSLTAFFASALLLGYVLALILWRRDWRAAPSALGGMALGLGLSAFFWLPAFGEREWVQVERLLAPPVYDFRNYFSPLEQLFGLQPALDVRQDNVDPQYRLGLVQVILAAVAGLAALLRRLPAAVALHLGLAGAITALLVFLMTPASTPLYEIIPMLSFIQFPWRFLGFTSLFLAVMAGAAVTAVWPGPAPGRSGYLSVAWVAVPALMVLCLVLAGFPFLYRDVQEEFTLTGQRADVLAFEKWSHTIGGTSASEFLPRWVERLPDPPEDLPAERLDQSTLPADAGATLVAHRGDYEAYRLQSERPTTLRFRLLYYPAWHAYVDGREVSVAPSGDGLGWLLVAVPPGGGLVELRFEDTPLVVAGKALTATAAVCLVLATLAWWRSARRGRPRLASTGRTESPGVWAVVLVGGGLLAAKVLYLDHHSTWFHVASPPGVVSQAQHGLAVNFGDAMMLLGYDADKDEARPGEIVKLRLYWEPMRRPQVDYASFVEVVHDPADESVARSEGIQAKWIPATRWRVGKYYADDHELRLPADLAPGDYLVICGLYDPAPGAVRLLARGTRPESNYAVLYGLTVAR